MNLEDLRRELNLRDILFIFSELYEQIVSQVVQELSEGKNVILVSELGVGKTKTLFLRVKTLEKGESIRVAKLKGFSALEVFEDLLRFHRSVGKTVEIVDKSVGKGVVKVAKCF